MTAAGITSTGFILDYSGANQVVVYTSKVVESYKKTIVVINPPNPVDQTTGGPKETRIVDLQRIQVSFKVDGMVDSADLGKLRNCLNIGSVAEGAVKYSLVCKWEVFSGSSFYGVMSDLDITKDQSEQDEKAISFTVVVGKKL